MLHKRLALLSITVLLAFSALPASANILTSATATADCNGYTLTVSAVDLNPANAPYTVDFTFNLSCQSAPVMGSITINASDIDSNGDATVTATGSWPSAPLNTICNVSGTATLTSSGSTLPIVVNGQESATLSCGPPPACVIPPSGTAIPGSPVSWNGFKAPAGSVVWINAHISSPHNVPTNTVTTVDFTGVSLVVHTMTYTLPDGHIVFNPATSTPTTVVNPDGSWTTTVNPSFNNDIFFDGQAIPVDSNLENGGNGNTNSTLSYSTNSSDSSLKFQWQWGAAVYTSWPGNAAANIEPVHSNLQAGAPQNPAVQADLIQGPRGGGGSNFTGSWSGTGQGTCPQ